MRVLLLTKCSFAEQYLEQQIRKLGHEVFCSETCLKKLISNQLSKDFLHFFQSVLLSETIPERESEQLLPIFEDVGLTIIQKNSQLDLPEKEQENLVFMPIEPSLEALREILISSEQQQKQKPIAPIFNPSGASEKEWCDYLHLSRLERKLIEYLIEAQGQTVPREELCKKIWCCPPNNSTNSQLSNLTKRIRVKMREANISEESLKTSWGNGYQLDQSLLEVNFKG